MNTPAKVDDGPKATDDLFAPLAVTEKHLELWHDIAFGIYL